MTGQELIDWIKENQAEGMEIRVQYRDEGGCYMGTDDPDPVIENDYVVL